MHSVFPVTREQIILRIRHINVLLRYTAEEKQTQGLQQFRKDLDRDRKEWQRALAQLDEYEKDGS